MEQVDGRRKTDEHRLDGRLGVADAGLASTWKGLLDRACYKCIVWSRDYLSKLRRQQPHDDCAHSGESLGREVAPMGV